MPSQPGRHMQDNAEPKPHRLPAWSGCPGCSCSSQFTAQWPPPCVCGGRLAFTPATCCLTQPEKDVIDVDAIDVDMPGTEEKDGPPHSGYLVTAPSRGDRFQLWRPVHMQYRG